MLFPLTVKEKSQPFVVESEQVDKSREEMCHFTSDGGD